MLCNRGNQPFPGAPLGGRLARLQGAQTRRVLPTLNLTKRTTGVWRRATWRRPGSARARGRSWRRKRRGALASPGANGTRRDQGRVRGAGQGRRADTGPAGACGRTGRPCRRTRSSIRNHGARRRRHHDGQIRLALSCGRSPSLRCSGRAVTPYRPCWGRLRIRIKSGHKASSNWSGLGLRGSGLPASVSCRSTPARRLGRKCHHRHVGLISVPSAGPLAARHRQ